MKYLTFAIIAFLIAGCNPKQTAVNMTQDSLQNEKIKNYTLLQCMYTDAYYPKHLVDKVKAVLVELCFQIEETKPANLDELYKLTHASTEKINDLEDEFYQGNSEIETVARECIAENFEFISAAYGFEADVEELIAPRNW